MYVQNVHHWHKHKHASVLAIGQLSHQSAPAPSLAIHAADAVADHQWHKRDSDVIFTSNVKTRMWANAQPDGRPAEHRWRPLLYAPKFG